MSAYFARMLNKGRYMSMPPTEREILSLLIQHFPASIRDTLRHLDKIEPFYNFLVEEDFANNLRVKVTTDKPSKAQFQNTSTTFTTYDRSREGEL